MAKHIIIPVAIPTELWQQWQYCNQGYDNEDIEISLSFVCQKSLESRIIDQWSNNGPYQVAPVALIEKHCLYGVFYLEDGKAPMRYVGDKDDTLYNKRKKARRLNLAWNKALYETEMRIKQDGALIV